MNSVTATPTAQSLFQSAVDNGAMQPATATLFQTADLGAQIQAGLGVPAHQVDTSEVMLLTLLIDDSSSIAATANEQNIRDGCNLILNALAKSKQADGILAQIRFLNGVILTPFVTIDQTPRLDIYNYQATGGTPLYDQSVIVLGTVFAKTQEFNDAAVTARSITVIITDGADLHSHLHGASDVAKIAKDMAQSESNIIAAMGISDGSTDFRRIFTEMGIQPRCIFTPGNSESELRHAFMMVSQSALQASQCAHSFSTVASNGFTS